MQGAFLDTAITTRFAVRAPILFFGTVRNAVVLAGVDDERRGRRIWNLAMPTEFISHIVRLRQKLSGGRPLTA